MTHVRPVKRSLEAAVDAAHRFGWFPRLQASREEPRVQSSRGSSRASSDRRRGVARAQIDEAPVDFAGAAPRAGVRQHLRAENRTKSAAGRPRPHRLRHDKERAARGREGGAFFIVS